MSNQSDVRTCSYASGAGPEPLLGQTIGANLAATVRRFGAREALVDCGDGRRWTYDELAAWSADVARGLVARGLAKGDRVGIWSPNGAEWVALQYATARVGIILVNLNPAYRSSELEFVLRHAGVRMLVTTTAQRASDYPAMAADALGRLPDLTDVVVIGDGSWDRLVADGADVTDARLDEIAVTLAFDDAINIQYTSGTTGFPKGATLSHRNILNNGFFVGELVGYTEADRICLPVPFYHCFGMVMGNLAATSHGAAMVIPAPLFDAEATLRAVSAERCTSLYGVPTMFIAELGLPGFADHDLSSLRTGIMAGSPCPVEVMRRVIAEMHMDEVAICYGMTETSPVSTQTRRDDDLQRRTATVGAPLPHIEVKVVDPATGSVVAPGVTGELCTRGYSVMLGYWDEPDKTAAAIDEARWMHTGDLAVMGEDGYVNIVGRIKDIVIRGGENIYPREIEEFLYGHPDIEDVQVIGVPDERYGEELVAWIRVRPGRPPLGADDVRAYCQGRIAHHKIPRWVKMTDSFPMTVTGKVRKVEMREISVDELDLGSVAGTVTA